VKPTAVVLLSGGLDSAVTAAIAARECGQLQALSFNYGQRHAVELEAAKRVAHHLKIHQTVIDLDMRHCQFASALTGALEVPKGGVNPNAIPITYVPGRNTILLSYALSFAEAVSAQSIYIGVNALDYSGYPDCRPEFIQAFNRVAALATRYQHTISVLTPLISLSKVEIIQLGKKLGVDLSLTHSCYDPWPTGEACGSCDSCRIRKKGFADADVPDPTRYAPGSPEELRRFYLGMCEQIAAKHSACPQREAHWEENGRGRWRTCASLIEEEIRHAIGSRKKRA